MARASKYWLTFAAVNGLSGTALSAYAFHGMSGQAQSWAGMGAAIQLVMALALIAIERVENSRALIFTRLFWVAGITGFSGSLYILGFAGSGTLGSFHWVTPIGGLCLMLGWVALMVASLRR